MKLSNIDFQMPNRTIFDNQHKKFSTITNLIRNAPAHKRAPSKVVEVNHCVSPNKMGLTFKSTL